MWETEEKIFLICGQLHEVPNGAIHWIVNSIERSILYCINLWNLNGIYWTVWNMCRLNSLSTSNLQVLVLLKFLSAIITHFFRNILCTIATWAVKYAVRTPNIMASKVLGIDANACSFTIFYQTIFNMMTVRFHIVLKSRADCTKTG